MKEIPLTQGQVALVDDGDYEELSKHKWHAQWDPDTRSFRAMRTHCANGRERGIVMARVIMNARPGEQVDHVHSGDTLNNQRANLRVCTNGQNKANSRKGDGKSSMYKGVSWEKQRRKWRVQITSNGDHYRLGRFTDERAAAEAYDRKARELFGEFALTNF
jgi:hypothetical protein